MSDQLEGADKGLDKGPPVPVQDLMALWRHLRGRATYSPFAGARPTLIEQQGQFGDALGMDAADISKVLKPRFEERPPLPRRSARRLLALLGLDAVQLQQQNVDPWALLNEPAPKIVSLAPRYGGRDFAFVGWDNFVEHKAVMLSELEDQGGRRLTLNRPPLRMLEPDELDPAQCEKQVGRMPWVRARERVYLRLEPAHGTPPDRDLTEQPLHLLLIQDVRINGKREILQFDAPPIIRGPDAIEVPRAAPSSASQAFTVPGEGWSVLRKIVAVITDQPLPPLKHIEGRPLKRSIDIADLHVLATKLAEDQASHKRFGDIKVWVLEYAVLSAEMTRTANDDPEA